MRPTVLVADDDEALCHLLALYLEHEGYEPVLAHDGVEALEKFRAYRPALVILSE